MRIAASTNSLPARPISRFFGSRVDGSGVDQVLCLSVDMNLSLRLRLPRPCLRRPVTRAFRKPAPPADYPETLGVEAEHRCHGEAKTSAPLEGRGFFLADAGDTTGACCLFFCRVGGGFLGARAGHYIRGGTVLDHLRMRHERWTPLRFTRRPNT